MNIRYSLAILTLLASSCMSPVFADKPNKENSDQEEHEEPQNEFIDQGDEELALKLLGQVDQDAVAIIKAIGENDKEQYSEHLYSVLEARNEIEEVSEVSMDAGLVWDRAYQLEIRSFVLAHKHEEAKTEADKKAIKTELKKVLSAAFDVRQAQTQFEIGFLRKELADVQERWEKRKLLKTKIVERRLVEMIGEDSELEW